MLGTPLFTGPGAWEVAVQGPLHTAPHVPVSSSRSSTGPTAGRAHFPIRMEQRVLHAHIRRCLCLTGESPSFSSTAFTSVSVVVTVKLWGHFFLRTPATPGGLWAGDVSLSVPGPGLFLPPVLMHPE